MENIFKHFILFSLFALHALFVTAQERHAGLVLQIPFVPEAVRVETKELLYYELRISNPLPDSLHLETLDVVDVVNGRVLLSVPGSALSARAHQTDNEPRKNNTLQTGDTAILYLEVSSDSLRGKQLSHNLIYTQFSKDSHTMLSVKDAAFTIPAEVAAPLGKPLDGGPWVAIYDPSWGRGHRRVRYTVDGTAFIPGRYAIDFMLVDSLGRYSKGDQNQIIHWLGYNAKVLAVADGIVAGVRNDFQESPTLADHPDYPPQAATGNYICLKIADHRYVFYEHLKPGTITVSPGQKVTKGQSLATIGFTGQTTGPHLHLHVGSSPSPLGAEGLPFSFEAFKLLGGYPDFDRFGKEVWKPGGYQVGKRSEERPAPNTVLEFSNP